MTIEPLSIEQPQSAPHRSRRRTNIVYKAFFILIVFILGFGGGYFVGRQAIQTDPSTAGSAGGNKTMLQMDEINPPAGYQIPVQFGNVGPQLLAAGSIDYDKFVQLYIQAGKPLNAQQIALLTKGSNDKFVINRENAQFLLNFLWALGLTNRNPLLTEGLMMQYSKANNADIGNFASTGGWTIGAKPASELYASMVIVPLTADQQARLVDVASAVYRPCCNNPTHFPDCNHGMAMLGLLELMASQNANADEMFATAKYVNAYWFPQQMLEVATYFKATQNLDFTHVEGRQVLSQAVFSGSGFPTVHQWLANNGLVRPAPGGGGGCAVQ
jgi:hypothetical protein